jgi:DNA-directed RNA polymerase subunit RPC12/RpoP
LSILWVGIGPECPVLCGLWNPIGRVNDIAKYFYFFRAFFLNMASNAPNSMQFGYCSNCGELMLLEPKKPHPAILIFLLFFTLGLGLILYYEKSKKKPLAYCNYCHHRVR